MGNLKVTGWRNSCSDTFRLCLSKNFPEWSRILEDDVHLRNQCQISLDVTLSVLNISEGTVRLLDPQTNTEVENYHIYMILFCVRGHDRTPESHCFAFTESHMQSFSGYMSFCEIKEAINWILYSFATAFCCTAKQTSLSATTTPQSPDSDFLTFSVSLEKKIRW